MSGLRLTTEPTTEVVITPALKRKLLVELRLYQNLKAQQKAIEHALEIHRTAIGRLRDETGSASINVDGFGVTRVTPTRSTLDKMLLITNGVSPAQIEASTIVKPGTAYEKISMPGGSED